MQFVTSALAASIMIAACSSGEALIPPGYEDKVNHARASLEGNWEGLFKPAFLFVAVRCRADGALLVVFQQRGGGGRHTGDYAVAMQGPGAADGSGGWSGGYGVPDVDADGETQFFFEESPERSCPLIRS